MLDNVLEKIIKKKIERIDLLKKSISLKSLNERINENRSYFDFKNKILDTIVATRLLFPDVKEKDFQRKDFPRDCIGRHSLKAWGNRIGNYKAQFETDWKTYSPEMLDYCTQDVEVTYNLWKMIEQKGYSQQAMDLEHEVSLLIFKQESYGFSFITDGA